MHTTIKKNKSLGKNKFFRNWLLRAYDGLLTAADVSTTNI